MSVCARVFVCVCSERFRERGWEGGRDERRGEEKKEEGYREWLQAATSVRVFFFSKCPSRKREMEMLFLSGGGEVEEKKKLSAQLFG